MINKLSFQSLILPFADEFPLCRLLLHSGSENCICDTGTWFAVMEEVEVTEEMKKEAMELLKKDPDELYEILGYQLLGTDQLASTMSFDERIVINRSDLLQKGQEFIEDNLQKIKKFVCKDWNWCKHRAEYKDDVPKLVEALLSLISLSFTALPVVSVAVIVAILIKYGLDILCNCA